MGLDLDIESSRDVIVIGAAVALVWLVYNIELKQRRQNTLLAELRRTERRAVDTIEGELTAEEGEEDVMEFGDGDEGLPEDRRETQRDDVEREDGEEPAEGN